MVTHKHTDTREKKNHQRREWHTRFARIDLFNSLDMVLMRWLWTLFFQPFDVWQPIVSSIGSFDIQSRWAIIDVIQSQWWHVNAMKLIPFSPWMVMMMSCFILFLWFSAITHVQLLRPSVWRRVAMPLCACHPIRWQRCYSYSSSKVTFQCQCWAASSSWLDLSTYSILSGLCCA